MAKCPERGRKKESEREREIEKEGGEDKEKKMASIYKSLPNE